MRVSQISCRSIAARKRGLRVGIGFIPDREACTRLREGRKALLQHLGTAVLFLFVGVAMLVVGVPTLIDAVRVGVSGGQTTGLALEVWDVGQDVRTRHAVVEYSVSDVVYETELDVDRDVEQGGAVSVFYYTASPDLAVSSSGRVPWLRGMVSVVGLVCLVLGARSVRSAIRGDPHQIW